MPGFLFPDQCLSVMPGRHRQKIILIKFRTHEEETDGQHQIAEREVRNVPFVAAAKAGREKSFRPWGGAETIIIKATAVAMAETPSKLNQYSTGSSGGKLAIANSVTIVIRSDRKILPSLLASARSTFVRAIKVSATPSYMRRATERPAARR